MYVDDLLIVSDSLEWIASAKRAIGEQFRMTHFGEAKFILGMDIVRNREAGTISLSQEQYTKEILEKYGMLDSTPSKISMAPTHYRDGEVASDQDKEALSPPEHETFRAILGLVNFLCMCTRPDIAFAVSVISRRQTAPTQLHMKQLKRLLRYLNGTRPMGITYGRPSQDYANDIKVFSDSDWAADTTTRRSQSGEVVMLNGGAVSWTSKQQEVVALSTTEAEYVAVSRAGQSAVHFRQLMHDVHQRQRGPTTVYEDNEGAVKLANNPMASNRTKHIDIKHHYIRELVDAKTVAVVSVGTTDMLADGLTKALPEPKHTMIFKRCMGAKPSRE